MDARRLAAHFLLVGRELADNHPLAYLKLLSPVHIASNMKIMFHRDFTHTPSSPQHDVSLSSANEGYYCLFGRSLPLWVSEI